MEKQANLEILDCTIRDGGYYNNWDFDDQLIDEYVKTVSHLPLTYIEIGYRSIPRFGFKGLYFNISPKRLQEVKRNTKVKIALMVDLKDIKHETDFDVLLRPVDDNIDLLRLTINPGLNPEVLLRWVSFLRSNYRFKLALNMMYASKWNLTEDIFNCLSKDLGIDYFYIVDSYGGLTQSDSVKLVDFVRAKVNPKTKLGFHGHNNLELALANTIAILNKIDIIDATVLGMGRGAGNLKLELILIYLQKYYGLKFSLNYLGKLTSLFQGLLEQYNWGTNLPYMIAGLNSYPQKDVMGWMQTKVISLDTMVNSINFNTPEFSEVRLPFSDNAKKVLLIGGGHSVCKYSSYIIEYLLKNNDIKIVFSSTKHVSIFSSLKNEKYLSIIGDEVIEFDYLNNDVKYFLSSNHKNIKVIIPDKAMGKSFILPRNEIFMTSYPNHLANCANLITLLEPSEVNVIGFDGYVSGTYIENGLYETNNNLFKLLSLELQFELTSLTPSRYSALKEFALFYLLGS